MPNSIILQNQDGQELFNAIERKSFTRFLLQKNNKDEEASKLHIAAIGAFFMLKNGGKTWILKHLKKKLRGQNKRH